MLLSLPFASAATDCSLLMFHLSYYSIALYIRLLQSKLTTTSWQSIELWKGFKPVLRYLCEASAALNTIFSFPTLFVVTSRLIIISSNLFVVICEFIKHASFTNWALVLSSDIVISLIYLLIILHAADMPIYQVMFL